MDLSIGYSECVVLLCIATPDLIQCAWVERRGREDEISGLLAKLVLLLFYSDRLRLICTSRSQTRRSNSEGALPEE